MKYFTLFFVFILSCSTKEVTENVLYGKWVIVDYKLGFNKEIPKSESNDDLIKNLHQSFQKSIGTHMVFYKDSLFYSEQQPNHESFWILNNNKILFSNKKVPFEEIYCIDEVTFTNDTLHLNDKTQNGFINFKLIKWPK